MSVQRVTPQYFFFMYNLNLTKNGKINFNMWRVGCFYGSGEELIKKAYQDSELSGREYERVVQYVNSIFADEKK